MRFTIVVFLSLSLSLGVFSQTFVPAGRFGITVNDRIKTHKFLNNEEFLLLVGDYGTVTWDIPNKEVIASADFENGVRINFAELSPDAKFVLSASRLLDKKPVEFSPAEIYAVDSGRKVHRFETPVTDGFWSGNGKTFVGTRLGAISQGGTDYLEKANISLFDGESFKLRATLEFAKLIWIFLSDDGERLFTQSIDAQKAEKIEVWNARTGELLETLLTGGPGLTKSRPILSRTNKYFGIVAKNKDGRRALFVWSTGDAARPVSRIAPDPDLANSSFLFSFDERSVVVDTGRSLEIYDLETQKPTGRTANSSVPDFWVGNNSVFLYSGMKGYDAATGRLLFAEKQVSRSRTETDILTNQESTVTADETFTRPDPRDRYFLTYSNNLLKVYTTKGDPVETLVSLPARSSGNIFSKLNERLEKLYNIGDTTQLFSRAGWSAGGQFLFTQTNDGGALTLWAAPKK